jgi:hypothetical protein
MSGLETLRDTMRKPVAVVLASATVLATGMLALWLAAVHQQGSETNLLQPACIALAIDRDTGTTTTQPCAGTPMLVAGTPAPAK